MWIVLVHQAPFPWVNVQQSPKFIFISTVQLENVQEMPVYNLTYYKQGTLKNSAEWNAYFLPIWPVRFIQYKEWLRSKINPIALLFKVTKVQII